VRARLFFLMGCALLAVGCHTDMWVQPKLKAQHESEVFEDGMGSRPKVPGTVARGQNMDDPAYSTGFDPATKKLVTKIPWERAAAELKLKTYKELLMHGKERFEIFCTPCHGQLGNGQGMIAQRGLKIKRQPGNYHTARLIKMADGHFFDVMTNGYGVMYSFASRIPVEDRWAIVTYIRALQRSQNPEEVDSNGTN
jgi:mono/diheme cytochrome c family protein